MARCRKCSNLRPGLSANGICPSCVRFHGDDCLPPPRKATTREACGNSAANLATSPVRTFADLFATEEQRPALGEQAQPSAPQSSGNQRQEEWVELSLRLEARLKARELAAETKQAKRPKLAPKPEHDRGKLLLLAQTGQLSIEQLEGLLNNLTWMGFTRAEGTQLRECQLQLLRRRGPCTRPALVLHSQSDWWSLER